MASVWAMRGVPEEDLRRVSETRAYNANCKNFRTCAGVDKGSRCNVYFFDMWVILLLDAPARI